MDEEKKEENNINEQNAKNEQLEINIEKENKIEDNNINNLENEIKEEKNEIKELKNDNEQNEEKDNIRKENDKEEITIQKENIINIKEANIKENEKNEDEKEENENDKNEIISGNLENKIIINNNENENKIVSENENKIIDESNQIPEDMRKVKLQESKEDENKYIVNLEEEKEYEKLISDQIKPQEDSDEDSEGEEETFPFCFLGDVQKKGEIFGFFNDRYLEIDSVKGLIKRYASSKEYPTNPMEIIPIKSLKVLKKVKKLPNQDYYEFNLSYIPENKTKEKMHVYRVRHAECRTKWFESLLKLYKHLVKGEPLPPINKNKLIFIDDQVGINQEIKQDTNKLKKR